MHTANRNTFSFIPDACYFSNHPSIASPKRQSLITREHQHICPILLEFCHSSPPLFKNHKNPEVEKKIQACETYIDRALYFPHADAQKSQYFAY